MTSNNNENYNSTKQDKAYFKNFILSFFIIFLIIASFGAGYYSGINRFKSDGDVKIEDALILNKKSVKSVVDFGLFWNAWDILKDKYVASDSLDPNKLLYGAIDGMLAATGDPYTTFFDPEENKEFNDDISGSFEGIGAEIGIRQNILTVISPLKESPAEKAGLLPGDKILKIDDASTADISLEEAVKRIRGPKNSEVKFVIFRNNGVEETIDITVKRDVITVDSVAVSYKDDDIAIIEINRFGEITLSEFKKAVKDVSDKKVKGIILDLRSNPGGYLETAVDLAGYMLPLGNTVVIEEDGNGKKIELKSMGSGILKDIYTVVLINEGSASASEILAGALRDNRENVRLVGMKSFGKGSVQELVSLPSGTALKVTVAKWLTPNGDQINEVGISPNEEVTISKEDFESEKDPQMDRAIETLNENISK